MAKKIKPLPNAELPAPFQRVLPGMGVKKDKLRAALYIYEESIVMQDVTKDNAAFKVIDPLDLANALAGEMSFGSGLLPGDEDTMNTLWWTNSKDGQVTAVWMPPGVRRLALSVKDDGPPERYDVPLPGLIFLCRPGFPPWVYAVTRRPASPKDKAYKAPLANVYDNGNSCPGSHNYPVAVAAIPEHFLRSFFTHHVQGQRSKKHSGDITLMWQELDKAGAKQYPLGDLYYHGPVSDLMSMRLWSRSGW